MTDKVKYIGLDISTSIIGISLLDSQGNLINLENINLKKVKCIFEKSDIVYNTFKKYLYWLFSILLETFVLVSINTFIPVPILFSPILFKIELLTKKTEFS